jgi:D-3-phosphoglycerate dehydrogenase / 2-oxoglutarate reductase
VRIAILDDYFDTLRTLPCFDQLAGHEVVVFTDHVADVATLVERLAGVEVLVLIRERTRVTAELLDRLVDLRLISQRSVYPHIDVEACTRLGIVVSSDLHQDTPSVATAELTWALILASVRRIPQQSASLRTGHWQESVGTTLAGKMLGVYGYGRIARVVAGYARAFEMRVQVWASDESRSRAAAEGWAVAHDRGQFFATSDVVTVHQRLVPATRHAITLDDLSAMAASALFVNTSRAGLVAPGALVAALASGRPGAAAVDVFEDEPVLDPQLPLLRLDNVVATPHIGYVTREEWDLQFADVFAQITSFAAGTPTNVVNPEVFAHRR